jgi:hypothetical protein
MRTKYASHKEWFLSGTVAIKKSEKNSELLYKSLNNIFGLESDSLQRIIRIGVGFSYVFWQCKYFNTCNNDYYLIRNGTLRVFDSLEEFLACTVPEYVEILLADSNTAKIFSDHVEIGENKYVNSTILTLAEAITAFQKTHEI